MMSFTIKPVQPAESDHEDLVDQNVSEDYEQVPEQLQEQDQQVVAFRVRILLEVVVDDLVNPDEKHLDYLDDHSESRRDLLGDCHARGLVQAQRNQDDDHNDQNVGVFLVTLQMYAYSFLWLPVLLIHSCF